MWNASFLGRILVAGSVIGFFILNGIQERAQKKRNPKMDSTPSIAKRTFALGKLAMVASWLLALVQALGVNLRMSNVPEVLVESGSIVMAAGVVLTGVAFIELGDANTIGLPTAETRLRTTGLYRISRNPVYLGFGMMCLGATLFTANPITLLLACLAWRIHHQIIMAEEDFLAKRFGTAYETYKRGRRRYL